MKMKRKVYVVLLVAVILILIICTGKRFMLTGKREPSQIAYEMVLNEIPNVTITPETESLPDYEESSQEIMEESQEPADNSLADYFEGWTVEIRSDEEQVQKILEENREMIDDFFEKHPDIALRWVDFSKFDFTGDGQKEMIMSLQYVETSGVISYNYVFDGQGDMMMKFISPDIYGVKIYKENDDPTFYICERMHMWADHNITMCEKITGLEEWEVHFVYIELELGPGSAIEYFVYDDFTEEEEESMWQDYCDGIYKVCKEKEAKKDTGELEQYIQSIEKLEAQEVEYIGCVY